MFKRHHLCSPISLHPGRQAIGPASEIDQSVVLLTRELNLALIIVAERINRDDFQPTLDLALKPRIQRAVEGQQQLQFRVAVQTRGLIQIHAATTRDKIVGVAAKEVWDIAKARERENVFGQIVQNPARHFASLRIKAVAKVDQQGRNLRMIEAIQGQGNHFETTSLGVVRGRGAIIGIEVLRLRIAVPIAQAQVGLQGLAMFRNLLPKGTPHLCP